MKKHIIDTDKNPKIPYDDWKVESHKGMGNLDWSKFETELYLSEKQKSGYINGNELKKELEGKNPLNANVLDYLAENPTLIPNEWRGKYVYFWGTIYRNAGDHLCVRYLRVLDDGSCDSRCYWVDDDFSSLDPAAVAGKSISPLSSETLNCKNLESLPFELIEVKIGDKNYRIVEK